MTGDYDRPRDIEPLTRFLDAGSQSEARDTLDDPQGAPPAETLSERYATILGTKNGRQPHDWRLFGSIYGWAGLGSGGCLMR